MLFYKIIAVRSLEDRNDPPEEETRQRKSRQAEQFKMDTDIYNSTAKNGGFFISDCSTARVYAGAAFSRPLRHKEAAHFLNKLEIQYETLSVEETTFEAACSLLRTSSRNGYIEDDDDFLAHFGIERLHRCSFREELTAKPSVRSALMRRASGVLSAALEEELTRILTPASPKKALGHPVHYIIETDDDSIFNEMKEILFMALVKAKRVKSVRCTSICSEDAGQSVAADLYAIAEGSTVVIDFPGERENGFEFADARMEEIRAAAKLVKAWRNKVLSILRFPRSCHKLKQLLFEEAGGCSFVELTEDTVFESRARTYLLAKADSHKVAADPSLYRNIQKDTGYSPADLNAQFDQWMDHHLKTVVYPQYSEISCARQHTANHPAKGNAYTELHNMTGLTEAKRVIDEALSYYKAQKLFAEKGLKEDHPAMHMVFTGNPGTAKTTVARLFSQIMKDNGLLSEGSLYEVGRADLVGQYVGWTAKIVKRKFRQAKGSVLFIDEAYSLLDDRQGMYGDEAINTIVQEMENHREDMVVIFAGYPDEMEQFLARNPGLRSRIAYHVPFQDYDANELWDIARMAAKQKGMQFAPDVKEKLLPIFEAVSGQKDFGNGRYVRNLIEKARMKQAARLVKMPFETVTKDDVATLSAEDFELPQTEKPKQALLGFQA